MLAQIAKKDKFAAHNIDILAKRTKDKKVKVIEKLLFDPNEK